MSNTHQETLAITYLLGQANPEQVQEFRTSYNTDEKFRSLVQQIEKTLAPLHEFTKPEQPPEGLLDDIMSEIGDDAPEAFAVPANDNLRGKVSFWRGMAAIAATVAIAAIASHFILTDDPVEQPTQTVQVDSEVLTLLASDQAPGAAVIIYDTQTQQVISRLDHIQLPDEGDFELWLVPAEGGTPISLGLIRSGEETRGIEESVAPRIGSGGGILAISLEPAGGSPGGGPTGPILYTGEIGSL